MAAYVHIPFCRRVCPYCDFAVTSDTSQADRYIDAVCREVEQRRAFDRPLDAVAIGGGTPTAIDSSDVARILGGLRDRFEFGSDVEISIEANPEDVTKESLLDLRDAGVTRVSLGVQSFDDDVLADLGRLHTSDEARVAVDQCRDVFASVSVDLMFGSPVETDASWHRSVSDAIGLGIDHLSTYGLTVERGTALSRAVAAGEPAPDPDTQADRWNAARQLATDAGFDRYETSNYAKPGHAVVYNLVTWAQGEYESFGTGAHSHRSGVRSWNVRRVDRYIERIEATESAVASSEELGPWEREVERLMLGLRRAAGANKGAAGTCLLDTSRGQLLVEAGILGVDGERLRIEAPLLADEVGRTLLALDSGDC